MLRILTFQSFKVEIQLQIEFGLLSLKNFSVQFKDWENTEKYNISIKKTVAKFMLFIFCQNTNSIVLKSKGFFFRLSNIYMGQKDQDGYYVKKCHFFFQQRNLNTPI